MSAYEFVEREKAAHPVRWLCRVLGVAPSGYWAWRQRGPLVRAQTDAHLSAQIHALHQASRQNFGAPRIQAALAAGGMRCGRKRVARF